MKRVVMYSGGLGSWGAACRVIEQHGKDDVTLLFTDTRMEDEDLYRFLRETSADFGVEITVLADGRDPWEVFHDVRYLGNTRVDPCSKILKRDLADKWLKANCVPAETVCYLGIDWTERHRYDATRLRFEAMGFRLEAPLCDPPYVSKATLQANLAARGIALPHLYDLGFAHNNCGGFCIKAGQGHFATLLEKLPERYAYHEGKEEALRQHLGKDVAILRDRAGGVSKPLTLRDLRLRIEAKQAIEEDEIGGCGCFLSDPDESALTPEAL